LNDTSLTKDPRGASPRFCLLFQNTAVFTALFFATSNPKPHAHYPNTPDLLSNNNDNSNNNTPFHI
jgi:hypothetical protein